jgi:hypothetical protein
MAPSEHVEVNHHVSGPERDEKAFNSILAMSLPD